jgi:hypothetical protein
MAVSQNIFVEKGALVEQGLKEPGCGEGASEGVGEGMQS